MKRVVYAPKISAYIKADSGVYDLTEFITDFSVDRKVNQVSSAELTIRNPHKVWTNNRYRDSITGEQKIGPIFHPMDPITIILTRLQNRPVQVFTGYCDSTPYLQLFPGTVTIKASCTLKKLLYTYFDPGLPFMREYLTTYGWLPTGDGSIINPSAEKATATDNKGKTKVHEGVQFGDSGIGELLFHILHDIGKWPKDTIYIQEMPPQVIELVSNLFDIFKAQGEESSKELESFLHQIIGSASASSGGTGETGNAGGAGPPSETAVTPIDVGRAMLTGGFPADRNVLAQGMAVVKVETQFGRYAPMCWEPNEYNCVGYWQIQLTSHPVSIAEANNLVESSKAAHSIWKGCNGGSFSCAWYDFEAGASSEAEDFHQYLSDADKAIELGPFTGSGNSSAQGTVHH